MGTRPRSDAPPGIAGRLRAAILRNAHWKFPAITHLYAHSLAGLALPVPPSGWSIELLREERIPELEKVWQFERGEVAKRLRDQERCYLGLVEGRIAHYSWVQIAGTHFVLTAARRLNVQPGELWIYHCRTFEWARGRGIYPTVLLRILWDHAQQGFKRAVIYTTAQNVASQRGILHAGFVPTGDLRAVEIGPLRVPWFGGRT